MATFRVSKDKNYTTINNTGLRDERLTWKAKGILAYILSLPDDWVFYMEEVATHSKDKLDSLKSGIKELKEHGYVKRYPVKNEKGKFARWEMIIYEVPQGEYPLVENPQMEKPLVDKPLVENPLLLSTKELSTNKPNTNKQNNSDVSMTSRDDTDIEEDKELDVDIKKKEKPSRHKFETCDTNGAKYLFEKIKGNNPKQKEPNFDSWANEFRLMRERDNREPQEIKDVIDWCQADPFWQGNILSPKKLREKFDQLTIQMNSKKGAKNNAESGGSNTNRYSQKGEYDYGF